MGEIEPRCVRLWNLSSILHRIPVFHLLNHLLVFGEEIQIMLNLESENHLILSWKKSGMWTCPWTSKSINSNFQDWRLHCKSLIFPVFFFFTLITHHHTQSMAPSPCLFFLSHGRETLSPSYLDRYKALNGFTVWCHVEVEVMRKGSFFNLQGISFDVASWQNQLIKIPC